MSKRLLQFIETAIFTKLVDKVGRELLQAMLCALLENPQRGDIIQGTGGAKKARIAEPGSGRGKRGSYRYIYFPLLSRGRVHLIFLYGKDEQADLSPQQEKIIHDIVKQLQPVQERPIR